MKPREIIGTVGIVIAVIVVILSLGYGFLRDFLPIRTVQILRSPNGKHTAVLKRMDFIDLNFWVIVEGQKVYHSPDFAPDRQLDFRERLIWDKTGDIVILEVTGRRLFGYNAQTQKSLSDAEIMSTVYAPEPNELEYDFAGEWPQERIKKEKQQ